MSEVDRNYFTNDLEGAPQSPAGRTDTTLDLPCSARYFPLEEAGGTGCSDCEEPFK